MIDFLGRHRLNLFQYLPKDEPWIRAGLARPDPVRCRGGDSRARAPSGAESRDIQRRNLSRRDDLLLVGLGFATIESRFAALWRLGVRSFTVAFDDIKATFPGCAPDGAMFGSGKEGLARAQAHVLNGSTTISSTRIAGPRA